MVLLAVYTIFFNIMLSNSMFAEDLEILFDTKHCIQASSIKMTLNQGEILMLDSKTVSGATVFNNNVVSYDKSFASKIHELAQFNNIDYLYKLVAEEGPPHEKMYTVTLVLGDEHYEGTGPNLKKAKQEAAALALENTFYEHPPDKIKTEQEKPSLTPTVVLNNIAMKLGFGVSYFFLNGKEEQGIESYGAIDEAYGKAKSYYDKINSTYSPLRVPVEESQVSGPFTVKVKVGDLVYKGFGHTIQAARHDAASRAIKDMEKQALLKDNVCSKEETAQQCKEKKESLKSPITRVYETAQKYNLPVEFDIISESGKSHKKVFVTQCKLGDFITEGEGASKKDSKRVAAENMLQYLPQLPEKYNEKAIVDGFSDKNKKKRKKKNKVIKDTGSVFDAVSNLASSLLSGDAKSDDYNPTTGSTKYSRTTQSNTKKLPSAKDKLLEVGSKLNIPVEFTDLNEHEGMFYTLVTLQLKPPHMCLGKAVTRDISHDLAASFGIKFLQMAGLLEKATFAAEENKESSEEYYEVDGVMYTFEEVEKSD